MFHSNVMVIFTGPILGRLRNEHLGDPGRSFFRSRSFSSSWFFYWWVEVVLAGEFSSGHGSVGTLFLLG